MAARIPMEMLRYHGSLCKAVSYNDSIVETFFIIYAFFSTKTIILRIITFAGIDKLIFFSLLSIGYFALKNWNELPRETRTGLRRRKPEEMYNEFTLDNLFSGDFPRAW